MTRPLTVYFRKGVMSNKPIMSEHLTIILEKMCDIADVDFDEMDFKKNDWYLDHSWSVEQEKKFAKWLTDYLFMSKEAREELLTSPRRSRPACRAAALMFVLNFGWKGDGHVDDLDN